MFRGAIYCRETPDGRLEAGVGGDSDLPVTRWVFVSETGWTAAMWIYYVHVKGRNATASQLGSDVTRRKTA